MFKKKKKKFPLIPVPGEEKKILWSYYSGEHKYYSSSFPTSSSPLQGTLAH